MVANLFKCLALATVCLVAALVYGPTALAKGKASLSLGAVDVDSRSLSGISYAFQIKMYWNKAMRWQKSSKKKQYCVECATNCRGDRCDSATCKRGRRIMITSCDADEKDQYWRTDGKRIMPQRDSDLCWTKDGKYIELDDCDDDDDDQEFTRFDEDEEFQIRPRKDRSRSRTSADCLTNPHHPKSREPLKMSSCKKAEDNDKGRYDDTSRWVIGIGFNGHSGSSNWDWDEGGYYPAA